MADRLTAGWLQTPATVAVMTALNGTGAQKARFVGGCVRNTIMGRPVDDIDIATSLAPDVVMTRLDAVGIRAVPTGIEHGTVTAIVDRNPFEITTLREDVETDGRHAIVRFTTDWALDASRRDFRLNAIYADADGTLHDPNGSGIEDARLGRVVFIGNPDDRLQEDYLRILRFFRFNAWYGQVIDSDGLTACARQKDGLRGIAAERIWKEFHKLLLAPDPRAAITAMRDCGILNLVLPDVRPDLSVFAQRVGLDVDYSLAPDPVHRLMTLIPRVENVANGLKSRLRLSNEVADRLATWARDDTQVVSSLSEGEARRALYWLGAQGFRDQLATRWAEGETPSTSPQWLALLAMSESYQRPHLPIGGEDVVAVGVPRGPKVGAVLKAVEDWWVEADFPNDKRLLIEQIKAVVQERDRSGWC